MIWVICARTRLFKLLIFCLFYLEITVEIDDHNDRFVSQFNLRCQKDISKMGRYKSLILTILALVNSLPFVFNENCRDCKCVKSIKFYFSKI